MKENKNKEFTTLSVDYDLSEIIKLLGESSGKSQVQILRELTRKPIAKLLKITTPKNMPTWTRNILVDFLIETKISQLRTKKSQIKYEVGDD